MRIGLGIDVHAFCDAACGRPLLLGGVQISREHGLAGHSDADVLTHAVMDALLGAARLGDIGEHFPSSDASLRDADSLQLLRQVRTLLRNSGWRIIDIDCVVIAQHPRLSPFRERICLSLASALEIDASAVGFKATTSDYLGFEGRGEGISAFAIALLAANDGHKQ